MCGIAGIYNIFQDYSDWINDFVGALQHRGPDDQNIWSDTRLGVVLGHRRLAILDLSEKGRQPMISKNANYVIVCNGEIYNFQELRKELLSLGHVFRGESDTEVMLASFEQWGVLGAVQKFRGMFAFALLEKSTNTLYLARDRMGIKPLYYGWIQNSLVFASELKPFFHYPEFSPKFCYKALGLFLRFGYIPAPYCIFENIFKLSPGNILQVSSGNLQETRYWSLEDTVTAGCSQRYANENEAIQDLEALLSETIQQHCLSDVPLGAFLSAGIDSSTIVSLMQAQSSRKVKTFSIGFHESGYDEAKYSKIIAEYLGTDHTEFYVTPHQALDVIPKLPNIYDEPFADSSQIPTFLVSQLTRQKVTVALSGDGGDELFSGYNRYYWAQRIWPKIQHIPPVMRSWLAKRLQTRFLGSGTNLPLFSHLKLHEKLPKIAKTLSLQELNEVYWQLVSLNDNPATTMLRHNDSTKEFCLLLNHAIPRDLNAVNTMMYLDEKMYLPDDILTKVDRASMAHGLEARVPFLDHKVVEFSWKIPVAMNFKDGKGKWLLRQILYKHVPKKFFHRPKMGFAIPLGAWLRGPLKDWGENLLDTKTLEQDGLFCSQEIQKRWCEHQSGVVDWQNYLWPILMFQAWKEHYAK